jgi:hypothetical protein
MLSLETALSKGAGERRTGKFLDRRIDVRPSQQAIQNVLLDPIVEVIGRRLVIAGYEDLARARLESLETSGNCITA